MIDSMSLVLRRQVVELLAGEATADHRCAAQHGKLARIEAVETAREQRLDRRRRLAERQLRGLSRRERAAAPRRAGCLRPARRSRARRRDRPAWSARLMHQRRSASSFGSGCELDDEPGRRRARPSAGRLSRRSPRASRQDEDRRLRPLTEILDEVQQGRLGPVDVVEHERPSVAAARATRRSRRTAQNASPGAAGDSATPISSATRSATCSASSSPSSSFADSLERRFGCRPATISAIGRYVAPSP